MSLSEGRKRKPVWSIVALMPSGNVISMRISAETCDGAVATARRWFPGCEVRSASEDSAKRQRRGRNGNTEHTD